MSFHHEVDMHYREHYTTLVARMRKRFPSDAEDMVQEAYVRLLECGGDTEELTVDQFFERHCIRRAKNKVGKAEWKHVKMRANEERAYGDSRSEAYDNSPTLLDISPEEFVIIKEQFQALSQALGTKKKPLRDVVEKVLLEGTPVQEVAEYYGYSSRNSVYKIVHRFLQSCKDRGLDLPPGLIEAWRKKAY